MVLLHRGIVFVLEFKVGERHYTKYALEQALDYGLDLKNFHSGSHEKAIVPMVVATRAQAESMVLEDLGDRLYAPLRANSDNLLDVIAAVVSQVKEPEFDAAALGGGGLSANAHDYRGRAGALSQSRCPSDFAIGCGGD